MRFRPNAAGSLLVLALLSACGAETPQPAIPPPPPPSLAQPGANLVLFLVDTLRADRLGPYGGDPRTSERLRELVEEGALFEDCRAPAPWTLPSIATLMTGLYPRTHGAQLRGLERNLDELGKKPPGSLDASTPQLATLLREKGYVTYLRATNLFLGFGIDAAFDQAENGYAKAEEVVDWSLEKLRAHDRARPFFLAVHFIDTHDPIAVGKGYGEDAVRAMQGPGEAPLNDYFRGWPSQQWTDVEVQAFLNERKRWYDASIRYVDGQLGRMRAELRSLDLGPTFFVFTSDHGEDFADHAVADRASRFRDPRRSWQQPFSLGHGHGVHASVTRVPLVIAGGKIPRGVRLPYRVGLVDFLPTICELLDLDLPTETHGRSFVPALQGLALAPRAYLTESLAYGREKAACFREDGWLLIQPASGEERAQLYDLNADPLERRDLAESRSEELEAARSHLVRFGSSLRTGAGAGTAPLDAATLDALKAIGYGGR